MYAPHNTQTEAPVRYSAEAKLLLDAAQIIRKHGLAKGTRFDDQGRVCVLGALSKAEVGNPWGSPWFRDGHHSIAAVKALADTLPPIPNSEWDTTHGKCAVWNNAPERTADEVINALESCARAIASVQP